jgi:hypothetical protein
MAKPSVRASVDRTLIGLGDRIEYTLTVTGDSGSAPDAKIPEFPGFDVTSTSQSSQFSFVNGSFSASKTVQLILVPHSVGTFTFPPAEIVVKGRVYKSESFTVTVKDGISTPPRGHMPRKVPPSYKPTPMPKGERVQGNLFINMNINKRQAYVGEQLVLVFSFYRRIRLFRQPEYEAPDTTGFWVEDMPSKKGEDSRLVNGRHYMVQEIKSALFPTAPGDYTIGPATLRVRTGFFTRPQILTTDPIPVKILPLPEQGRPAEFTGAIGHFVLSASLDKKATAAQKPVTLVLTVAGGGNIKAIKQPEIKIPEGIRKYESKTVENITPDFNQVTGEKRYETILVPQKEGDYTIAPIKFTYFDPDSAQYKTLSSKPLALRVTPGEGADQQIVYAEPRQTEIALLNRDIRFIKPLTGKLKNQGELLFEHPWFWYGQGLPVLIVLVLFVYMRQREKTVADIRSQRIKRAHKMAKKRLRTAEKFRKESDAKSFYAEISRALCEYMGDKLNTAAQGMVLDDIRKKLTQREIPTDQIEPVIALLEQCDMARFTSHTSSDEEMRRFLNETEEIIVRLDKLF